MIDNATVQRILDSADIVEVVSDFVTLKKRGQNYVGLCPFHNDRTPSFYVSKNKQLCKCFACGEGGSPVGFIMKHESMSYVDALKYLARKYHIEIHEREMTDKDRENQRHRDSLLMVNEWACKFFETQLHDTTEGHEVGLAYFTERGFGVDTIKKFRLGYSPEDRRALYNAATKEGFSRELLFETGLCVDDNRGGGYDRYRGRVIFPILNIAGNIVAFGGRTLKKDKNIAKYVNSPESIIYSKRKELYGLYQAKREISKKGKCFIVEGYADVISMHQSGFCNVIASSGTALTTEHIHMIHRFTENVTEMFDGDEAGIRAALKGIDKILAQGLNMKVLLLPDDDDPDSYSRKHSASEIEQYIQDNETDFITFKSNILLKDCGRDPIKRAAAIDEITKSIAAIPSEITRSVYAKVCSEMFGIAEDVILRSTATHIAKLKEEQGKERLREKEQQRRERLAAQGTDVPPTTPPPPAPADGDFPMDAPPLDPHDGAGAAPVVQQPVQPAPQPKVYNNPQEKGLIRLLVKFGMCNFSVYYDENNVAREATVIDYVRGELDYDNMQFTVPVYKKLYDLILSMVGDFNDALPAHLEQLTLEMNQLRAKLMAEIDPVGHSVDSLQQEEQRVQAVVDSQMVKRTNDFRAQFLAQRLCSHPDDEVRNTASDLVSEKYSLSKIHTEFASIPTEQDRLGALVPSAIYNWKAAIVDDRIKEILQAIATTTDQSELTQLMTQLQSLYETRSMLAKVTGERVVNAK